MKTLIDLYLQPSYDQKDIPKIQDIIKRELKQLGYVFNIDAVGNMYCEPRAVPMNRTMLCAHMDMVKTGEPIANVLHFNGVLQGLDKNNHLTSLGADDKNGIWIAIQAAKNAKIKPAILFVAHEEGTPHTVDDWIKNNQPTLAMFDNCLVLDRKGSNEIIYAGSANEYSHVLAIQWKTMFPEWEYTQGVMCDADRLIKEIPCINLSIGYYNGHSVAENTVITEMVESAKCVIRWLNDGNKRNELDWKAVKEFNKETNKTNNYYGGNYGKI